MKEFLSVEDRIEISQKHVSFALEKLREAGDCLEKRLVSSCIAQSYYACFHMAKAVLYSLGVESGSDDDTYLKVSLHVFTKAKEGKELSLIYSQIRDVRDHVDHDAVFYYSVGGEKGLLEIAMDVHRKAIRFVEVMARIRKEVLSRTLKGDEKNDGAGKGRKRKNLRKR